MTLLRRHASPPSEADVAGQPPALPVPGSAGAELEALLGELREAARAAGVQRDDPMMPLLAALARSIRFLAVRTAGSDRLATDASRRIVDAIAQSRQSADAEALRFRVGLAATEADTIQRIARGIAASADAALRQRVAVFDRNTALIAAAVLVGCILAAAAGGFWWGDRSAKATIHQTEWRLQAAFRQGEEGASLWAGLMEWNHDILGAIRQCRGAATSVQDGRRACAVPLWIELSPGPPAPTAE